jgi:hypothetical protein
MIEKEKIKSLESQISILEKQKKILMDALDIISSAYNPQSTNDLPSARKALELVQKTSLLALAEAVAIGERSL